jgi:hypothetical protein
MLNSTYPPVWRAVVYTVFGDESHDEASARVFAVAGLFGSEDDWGAFNAKWSARTGGKVFHAADCETDKGDYGSSPHPDNLRLYKDLVHILADSKILGFGTAMDLAGWREFFPGVPEDIPYYRCFRDVVLKCGDWTRWAIPRGTVKFTFDQRIESNYNAGILYTHMAEQPEWTTYFNEEISFASRKLVGIQAADLYAREVMKHLDNIVGPVKRPIRRSLEALQSVKRFGADFLMREHFADFRRQFNDVAARVGMSPQLYVDWLNEHKISDNISSRHRYLIELDHKKKAGN